MKVSELSGALLDYWVCRADGLNVIVAMRENCDDTEQSCLEVNSRGVRILRRSPSTSWAEGGPIIERERIDLAAPPNMDAPDEHIDWAASIDDPKVTYTLQYFGEKPLIAAMRAYVASKFGDEVPEVKS